MEKLKRQNEELWGMEKKRQRGVLVLKFRVHFTPWAEHRRIDAFELWCWRRLLRVPWTARRSYSKGNQSLEGLMLKLKLQYFGHLMWTDSSHLKRPWCWERLKAGGEGGDRGWDHWTASPTQWTWVWANSRSWWQTWKPVVLQSMGSQRVRHD